MVKNKALPDSARLCTPRLVTLSLSLSPSETWTYQGWSHMSSLSLADAVHPEGTPWILPRLDPGTNCCFLTCIQISQEVGQVLWYSHLLKNFPQFIVIHTIKVFGIKSIKQK